MFRFKLGVQARLGESDILYRPEGGEGPEKGISEGEGSTCEGPGVEKELSIICK